ncbi:DUF1064 domain-containing protein [Candidatus Megaera polyxenophila]|nr:DUF1064 domain-containing protein [Candidatus Megaera polyxenophila]
MAILRHKFRAKPCVADGIKFASLKERKRYRELKFLQEKGEVLFFLRQTPFHLKGGVKYVCDFLVFWTNGEITIEDVKGVKTDMYILKKKMVEATYPITITEV